MYCFPLFCRLCIRKDIHLIKLTTSDDDMITFSEKLKLCMPEIVFDEDGIPNLICDICCRKLRKMYEFKKLCLKNHIVLVDYASQLFKYMESASHTQNNLNADRNDFDKNNKHYSKHKECIELTSDDETDSSEEINMVKTETRETDECETNLDLFDCDDKPLALVKCERRNSTKSPSDETCLKNNTFDTDKVDYIHDGSKNKKIKTENESDDDEPKRHSSSPLKDGAHQKVQSTSEIPYALPNEVVMKYLQLEYSENQENNREHSLNNLQSRSKNIHNAGSDTEAEDSSSWNTSKGSVSNKMKTRTSDKYRIVYTDSQRLELEKEFTINRYISTSRKNQLSSKLKLSPRQIKIWFQNRRAKERKQVKKSLGITGSEMHTDITSTASEGSAKNCPEQIQSSPDISSAKELSLQASTASSALVTQGSSFTHQPKDIMPSLEDFYKKNQDLISQRLQVLIQQQQQRKPPHYSSETSLPH